MEDPTTPSDLQKQLKALSSLDALRVGAKALTATQGLQEAFNNLTATGLKMPNAASVALRAFPELPKLKVPEPMAPEQFNSYQSAAILMKHLAEAITLWRNQLPDDKQPAVLAILHGGVQINVARLAQESFHGIRIEGTSDKLPCLVFAHQSTVQLLCYAEDIAPPETPKRKIGFIIDGEETEA